MDAMRINDGALQNNTRIPIGRFASGWYTGCVGFVRRACPNTLDVMELEKNVVCVARNAIIGLLDWRFPKIVTV